MKQLIDRLAYFLEGIWLPIRANLCGLHHSIRGHNIEWFKDPDVWRGHLGWIYCTECSDTEVDKNNHTHNDLVIWGFYFHRIHRLIIQPICGFFGHKEAEESMTRNPSYDNEDNDPVFDQPTGRFYCSRCDASLPPSQPLSILSDR